MKEQVLNIIKDLLKIEYDYNQYTEYQKFSIKIIEMNLKDMRWADKQNLMNDIVFRLKDAFGIEESHINKLEEILTDLPQRYHKEFINDVLVDQYSIINIRKVHEYYINDILNELTEEEKKPYYEKFLFIELR